MREMRCTERRAIADPDDAHRSEPARLRLREKATLDRRQQCFRHGMAAPRAADQDRVAVLDELCRFVRSDLFHGPHVVLMQIANPAFAVENAGSLASALAMSYKFHQRFPGKDNRQISSA